MATDFMYILSAVCTDNQADFFLGLEHTLGRRQCVRGTVSCQAGKVICGIRKSV